jgi:hypothetical protein
VVEIPVEDELQIVDYSLEDVDGLVGRAFIIVPGADSAVPVLDPDVLPAEVVAGETINLSLADHVLVRSGRTPRVATAALTSWHAAAVGVVSDEVVFFTAPADYNGPASVSVPVMDGAAVDGPGVLTAVVTIPVTVLPNPDAPEDAEDPEDPEAVNAPPALTGPSARVERGGEAVTLDLAPYARDPEGDELVFAVDPPGATGVEVVFDAAAGVSLRAQVGAAEGVFFIPMSVSDQVNPPVTGVVSVMVVATTKPAPRALPDVVGDVHQGRPVAVPVLENDFNPFPDEPLRIVDAQIVAGDGSGVAHSEAGEVSATPGPDFEGVLQIQYTVQDAVGRSSSALVSMQVLSRPERVRGVQVTAVGDRRATVGWSVPYNGGSPVVEYRVAAQPGGAEQSCGTANICQITGLTNNVEYVFTVVAVNAVGPSDPSQPSGPARPDVFPNLPAAPALVFGDGSLEVSWSDPGSSGSPVTAYDLEISPAPPGGARKENVAGTRLTWAGLANGTAYRVRVCAKNRAVVESANQCADELLWGPESNSEIPAGKPAAPAAPTVEALQPVGAQAQFKITWPEPAANGDAVRRYDVEVSRGGAVLETIAPTEGPTGLHAIKTFDVSTEDYTFRVRASNKAGDGLWSDRSAAIRAISPPGQVRNLRKTGEGDHYVTVAFDPAAGNGARPEEIEYRYNVDDFSIIGSYSTGILPAGGGRIDVLRNQCFTIWVVAISSVGNRSTSSSPTELSDLCAYGPPNKPGVSASAGADTVTLSWTIPAANGRPVSKVQISVDGGAWQDKTGNGSVTAGNGRNQTHSIKARAIDSEGQISAEASASASTWGSMSASITKGGSTVMWLHYENFPDQEAIIKIWRNPGDLLECVRGGPRAVREAPGTCGSRPFLTYYKLPGTGDMEISINPNPGDRPFVEVVGIYTTPPITW